MTVILEDGDLIYIDKKGNKFGIDEDSWYCEMTFCENTHRQYSIPVLGFISGDSNYFGDYLDKEDYESLNQEIEEYLTNPDK